MPSAFTHEAWEDNSGTSPNDLELRIKKKVCRELQQAIQRQNGEERFKKSLPNGQIVFTKRVPKSWGAAGIEIAPRSVSERGFGPVRWPDRPRREQVPGPRASRPPEMAWNRRKGPQIRPERARELPALVLRR